MIRFPTKAEIDAMLSPEMRQLHASMDEHTRELALAVREAFAAGAECVALTAADGRVLSYLYPDGRTRPPC